MSNLGSEHLDNEWFVVRHSGELPEVALHASLHYLTQSADGPGLTLAEHQVRELQVAAMARYRDIILRDLLPENRDASMYRGVKRSIINYQRYLRFCHRQGLEIETGFVSEVIEALCRLLETEVAEVTSGARDTSINCSYHELECFATELGMAVGRLPRRLGDICPVPGPSGEVAII